MKTYPLIASAVALMGLPSVGRAAVSIDSATTTVATVEQVPSGSFKILFNDGALASPFEEFVRFTTTKGGLLSVTASTSADFAGGPSDTDFSSVSLFRAANANQSNNGVVGSNDFLSDVAATPESTDVSEIRQLSNFTIVPGSYAVRLKGTPRYEHGRLGGEISLTAPGAVPEPATWAMMAIGLGMLGAALRRKQQKVHSGWSGRARLRVFRNLLENSKLA